MTDSLAADELDRLRARVAELEPFERMADALPFGAVVFRVESPEPRDLRYVYANPGSAKHSALDTTSLIGATLGERFPEDVNAACEPDHIGVLRRVMATRIAETLEVERGARGTMLAHVVPLGERELACIYQNVTATRQAEHALRESEARLRQLADELERRVQERSAQLEAINTELQAFSYSVAHDLRAPLRGMAGFAAVLLADHAGALDADGRDCLAEIQQNARRMGDLIDALLTLSQVTRGELRRQPVDLAELAREVARELATGAPERRVDVDIPEDLHADVDPHLARVLVANLLANAWKFTERAPAARIEMGKTVDGASPAFFVRDNGAGFDMAYASKLFTPFQRLHAASEFPGTGIGLATVQRIVHRHGGRVWAEGTVDGGATFYFTLPSASDGAAP